MRIIAFGDVHMELGALEFIPDVGKADLLIITGDLTNFGGRPEAGRIIDRVRAINQNLLALPGNLDQGEVGNYLTENKLNLHGKGRLVNGIGIFGLGGSNPTPFKTPTEYGEKELADFLLAGYEQVRESGRLIMVSHAPPYNTTTDQLSNGSHVGSSAVRRFIEEHQPEICLTGHIHEARGTDQLGPTRIFNPGMIKDGGWIEIIVEEDRLTTTLHP